MQAFAFFITATALALPQLVLYAFWGLAPREEGQLRLALSKDQSDASLPKHRYTL